MNKLLSTHAGVVLKSLPLLTALWGIAGIAHANPVLVKDINAGPEGSEIFQTYYSATLNQSGIAALGNGKGLVMLKSGTEFGLYVTDGTGAGTSKLVDLATNSRITLSPHVIDGYSYFWLGALPGNLPEEQPTLWRSNGTVVGTGAVWPSDGFRLYGTESIARLGNRLLFAAKEDPMGRNSLWVSDGTDEGTVELSPYCTEGSSGYGDPRFSDLDSDGLNGYQYFGVTNCTSAGHELWRTDGTDEGTERVAIISDSTSGLSPMMIKYAGDRVFFRGYTGGSGFELWTSDGTEAGTKMVVDLVSGGGHGRPLPLRSIGNKVLFSATSDAHSREYWVSDGTEEGTMPLTTLGDADTAGFIGWTTKLGDLVYFTATANGGSTEQLMRTDGTPAGTVLIKAYDSVEYVTAVGSKLFMQISTSGHGAELWGGDGTAAGTKLVKDIFAGANDSAPHNLYALSDSKLIFLANDGSHGVELWLHDASIATPTPAESDDGGGGGGSVPMLFAALGLMLGFYRKHS